MKRVTLLVIVAFCGAAIAANVPRSVIHGKTPDERRSEVFSAFVTLSAEPGTDAIPFMNDWADLTGQTKRMQLKRLEHIPPRLLAFYADQAGLTVAEMTASLSQPDAFNPFDTSGGVFDTPAFDLTGETQRWHWGVSEQSELRPAPDDANAALCRIWLVFWNDETWFFAPVGTVALNAALSDAVPDLAAVMFESLPQCETDA